MGPNAQFMPTLNSGTWEIEFQNASTVWPVTPRLLPGWMNVTEAISGKLNLALVEQFQNRKERRLGVERIEDRFDQ